MPLLSTKSRSSGKTHVAADLVEADADPEDADADLVDADFPADDEVSPPGAVATI